MLDSYFAKLTLTHGQGLELRETARPFLIFAKATKRNYLTIKNTFNKFYFLSGQKINFSKSRIYISPLTSPNNIIAAKSELDIRACSDFGKYLGVPILTNKRNTRTFNFLIDELHSRLANWKASALSLASRLTLITAVTIAIPTHIMQNTMLPSKICKEIDKINKNFLWGDFITKCRIHFMNWNSFTLPKAAGGLSIKTSTHRNKALLAKRLWDIRTHPGSLHALMFKRKYPHPTPSKRTSPAWASLFQAKNICDSGSRWLIHNGNSSWFWHDNWTGFGPLRSLIHGPLNWDGNDLRVRDVWDHQGQWSLHTLLFVLPHHVADTIHATPKPLSLDQDDLLSWNYSANGISTQTRLTLFLLTPLPALQPTRGNGFGRFPHYPGSLPFFGWPAMIDSLPRVTSTLGIFFTMTYALSAFQGRKLCSTF